MQRTEFPLCIHLAFQVMFQYQPDSVVCRAVCTSFRVLLELLSTNP